MSTSRERQLIEEMMARTEADDDKARFYMELAEWNLENALEAYYTHERSDGESEPAEAPEPRKLKSNKDNRPKGKRNTSNFATVQSLAKDSSSDEDDKGQAFYAGGSIHSGQQILGPGKQKRDFISDMFRSVKERGGSIHTQQPGVPGPSTFSGTGYKLGTTPDDTTVIRDPNSESSKDSDSDIVVVLRLWKNGFSLDDGELRPYDDPENAEFLQYVKRGEIPPELRTNQEVYLTMEDRRHEDFACTCKSNKPFQGKGHLLGSPAPTILGSTMPQPVGAEEQVDNQKIAQEALKVNENEPVTTVQFRLADGSRISGRFNHTHTIANVREFIVNSVPAYQLQTFVLLTSFPNKELSDNSQTIKDAGILNALVLQRLK